MKNSVYITNLSLALVASLLSWFAWKDFRPWLSASWDALVVVTIIGGYLWHTFQLRRLSRSIPQDYWDSIKQNPDMLRYERHRVYGLLFLVLFSALIAWRIVKDFHL